MASRAKDSRFLQDYVIRVRREGGQQQMRGVFGSVMMPSSILADSHEGKLSLPRHLETQEGLLRGAKYSSNCEKAFRLGFGSGQTDQA